MIIVSMNVRGLGGVPKRRSLQRLLNSSKTDIILFQETMEARDKFSKSLSYFLPGWNFVSLDVEGQSRCLILGWNDYVMIVSSFSYQTTILIQGKSNIDHTSFKVLNIYYPYRREFWEGLRQAYFWGG